jgi:hypothetical protein
MIKPLLAYPHGLVQAIGEAIEEAGIHGSSNGN